MYDSIESTKNLRIKAAARLRERRARKQTGLILIDGTRELNRAIDAGVEIVEAFVCASLATGADELATIKALRAARVAVFDTAEPAFNKLRFGERDDGIVAVARRPHCDFDSLGQDGSRSTGEPLIAVLEGVEKPGNLGALLRTADAVGVHAVIAADARGDVFGPNAIRASLGAVFTVPLVEATSEETRAWLRGAGFQVVTVTPSAEVSYLDVSYAGATAFVFGAEATGVSDVWRGASCRDVRVPMHGCVDSLNVSTTAAVLLFEALRQRAIGANVI